jgi:transcriptional regulator with XRE-family HTH domain
MESTALRIQPFGVDAPQNGSKNGWMTKEQLQQFAEEVRKGRARLNINKVDFAKRAKIAPNTLRALERGVQQPNQETIDKIARILGTTAQSLTHGKRPIDAADPLLADLNDEDLEVAQAFHHAPMRVKQRALGVLQEGTRRGRKDASVTHDVTEISKLLLSLDPEPRQAIINLIAEFQLSKTTSTDEAAPPAAHGHQPASARAKRA